MKVTLVSLGCPKNQVDSDIIAHGLLKAGHTTTADMTEADVCVINTCGFITSAKEEAIENIFNAVGARLENPKLKIVVTGCLAESVPTTNCLTLWKVLQKAKNFPATVRKQTLISQRKELSLHHATMLI